MVTLGARQNCLDTIRGNVKLLRNFGDAHSVIEVIHHRVDGHPRTTPHGNAALYAGSVSTNGHSDQSIFSFVAIASPLSMILIRRLARRGGE